MVTTRQETTPSQNAIVQLRNVDSTFLLFEMVDGVRPMVLLPTRSTHMADRRVANQMAKVDHWLIKSITSLVRE